MSLSPDPPAGTANRSAIDLEQVLGELVVEAVSEELPSAPVPIDPVVRPSKYADYQVNGALPLAKALGVSPRDVADGIARHLAARPEVLSAIEVAGPGFINCTFADEFIDGVLGIQSNDIRLGRRIHTTTETIVIDYGSPNVAKEMHVGHLRSTVIGDALARILTGGGADVVRQNHLGDWGTQFGMLIEHMLEDEEVAAGRFHVTDLDSIYRNARAHFDTDDDFKDRARKRVVALQSGDQQTLRLWQMLVDESKRHFDELYFRLGTLLTNSDYRGESMYNDQLEDTVAELREKDLLKVDEGALCAFPEGFTGPDDKPFPLIVRKSDGGYGYAATDLAALRYNRHVDGADRVLYVTDGRQAQHFAMVIAVARDAGWVNSHMSATHVPFGMVLGRDGKPFKTRAGNTARLVDLVDEAVERADAKLSDRKSDLSSEEIHLISNAVGIGALKWADLKNDRTQNYVFDTDAMISFDGNTGPYIQYAATRARSVLRKAGDIDSKCEFRIRETAERELALHLLAYGSAIERVANTCEPHHLCTYLYELAGRFSGFYEQCPVLTAGSEETRSSRLALCDLTARVLTDGLSQLGIDAPPRM